VVVADCGLAASAPCPVARTLVERARNLVEGANNLVKGACHFSKGACNLIKGGRHWRLVVRTSGKVGGHSGQVERNLRPAQDN